MAKWIALVLVGAFLVFLGTVYNILIRLRNAVKTAWSDVDVFLKKRRDLVPNLVATVKGYAKHEKKTLEDVVKARASAVNAQGPSEEIAAENALSKTLKSLFAVVENYPELKADKGFLQLQTQLQNIEEEIEKARRFYNNTVKRYDDARQTFPNVIVASLFRFESFDLFKTIGEEREVPKVDFSEESQQENQSAEK